MEQLSEAVWTNETTHSPLDERPRLEPLYLELDLEQARRLALRAIVALERLPPRTEQNGYAGETPINVLGRIACFVPDALAGLHSRLLDANAHRWSGFYQGEQAVIFRNADTATRDRLIAVADTSPDYYEMSAAMHVLAWIGDDVVSERFFAWAARDGMSPGWWALFGGWQVEERPPPRRLTTEDSYRIETVHGDSPVRVMVPTEERCRRCNTVLVALFDLDLTDVRVGGSVRGTRLRVLTCVSCGLASHFLTTVDRDGHTGWSELNESKDGWQEGDVSEFPIPLGLGRAQRTPYEAMAFEDHRSQLFGHPTWVQSPEYPQCPHCEELMQFVGQIDTSSELPLWEGMIYAFVDSNCGLAATCYQQT
ncbi:MAG TPA: hypothetical protein VMZ73_01530 [Acidimicrobiales bacterium]|nr:hypothetical protein [Acidimicrobiales bacterium]